MDERVLLVEDDPSIREVAGLGLSPNDVIINGSIYVRNQCFGGNCIALNNFWRSLSNLTINVNTPGFGCYNGEFWAVSQAAPMRSECLELSAFRRQSKSIRAFNGDADCGNEGVP